MGGGRGFIRPPCPAHVPSPGAAVHSPSPGGAAGAGDLSLRHPEPRQPEAGDDSSLLPSEGGAGHSGKPASLPPLQGGDRPSASRLCLGAGCPPPVQGRTHQPGQIPGLPGGLGWFFHLHDRAAENPGDLLCRVEGPSEGSPYPGYVPATGYLCPGTRFLRRALPG